VVIGYGDSVRTVGTVGYRRLEETSYPVEHRVGQCYPAAVDRANAGDLEKLCAYSRGERDRHKLTAGTGPGQPDLDSVARQRESDDVAAMALQVRPDRYVERAANLLLD
jgi:hypothetical protein